MLLTAMHVRAPDASTVGDVTHLYFHGCRPGDPLPFDLDAHPTEWVSQERPGEYVGGRSTLTTHGNLVLTYLDLVAPDYADGTTIQNWVNGFLLHLESRGVGDETRVVYEWPIQDTNRAYALKASGKYATVVHLAELMLEVHQVEAARWSRESVPVTFWVSKASNEVRIELDPNDHDRLLSIAGARSPLPRSYTVPEEVHANLLRSQSFDALALDAIVDTLTGLTLAQLLPLGGLRFQTRGDDQPTFVWPGRA